MNILAFAGSLRSGSLNKALLRNAKEAAPEGMEIEIFDLEGIPLFNADLEKEGVPERVNEFKEAIRRSDGILIASPEYNHGMSGVTKNAVDWASRPPKNPVMMGKPAAIVGASPGITGTARSQEQLRQTLKGLDVRCMASPEFLLYRAKEKLDDEGVLTDDSTRDFLKTFMKEFADWVSIFLNHKD